MEPVSSFSCPVAELVDIKGESKKEKLRFNILLSSCQKSSETIIFFQHTKYTFFLVGFLSRLNYTIKQAVAQYLFGTEQPLFLCARHALSLGGESPLQTWQ